MFEHYAKWCVAWMPAAFDHQPRTGGARKRGNRGLVVAVDLAFLDQREEVAVGVDEVPCAKSP